MVRDIPKYLLRKSSHRGKMRIKMAVVVFTVRVMMNTTEDRIFKKAGLSCPNAHLYCIVDKRSHL